jgi:hypothetical protein
VVRNFSYQLIDVKSKNLENSLLPDVRVESASTDSVTQNTKLSIIILTRNRKEELSRALQSMVLQMELKIMSHNSFLIMELSAFTII